MCYDVLYLVVESVDLRVAGFVGADDVAFLDKCLCVLWYVGFHVGDASLWDGVFGCVKDNFPKDEFSFSRVSGELLFGNFSFYDFSETGPVCFFEVGVCGACGYVLCFGVMKCDGDWYVVAGESGCGFPACSGSDIVGDECDVR